MLQNAGSDACLHILAALGLEHDAAHALQVQELGQEQPRWTGADDSNLRARQWPSLSWLPSSGAGRMATEELLEERHA